MFVWEPKVHRPLGPATVGVEPAKGAAQGRVPRIPSPPSFIRGVFSSSDLLWVGEARYGA